MRTRRPSDWVAGFYSGNLTLLFEAAGDSAFDREALHKKTLMDPQHYNTGTHDLGFMMDCCYGNLSKSRHGMNTAGYCCIPLIP